MNRKTVQMYACSTCQKKIFFFSIYTKFPNLTKKSSLFLFILFLFFFLGDRSLAELDKLRKLKKGFTVYSKQKKKKKQKNTRLLVSTPLSRMMLFFFFFLKYSYLHFPQLPSPSLLKKYQ